MDGAQTSLLVYCIMYPWARGVSGENWFMLLRQKVVEVERCSDFYLFICYIKFNTFSVIFDGSSLLFGFNIQRET